MSNLSISLLAIGAVMLLGGQIATTKDLDGKELVDSIHCQQKGGQMQWVENGSFFVKTLKCQYPQTTPIEFVNN
ncbi:MULTISPECIES: hypothetical protein [Actinobacillus]|uniref:Uncharacterized protein n=2 Tax=Actinobacillus suis TaxID=716 RepID=K0G3J0_ACTSU|nr:MULTISPECIES: hypothetical protein [Actinobacillus]AFU18663.1 hypothetical protein ASU2_02605 [Actinobacillus suis H91-0380]MCO4167101.1 hypothetical protein [Actinobacillus suis]MCO4169224.1 hypothetical protein [Actinobacillus suis]MCQ9629828.1 hypothetical protein [Actinobacillus suis]MCQ9632228.1 hypothetical protein [Actinobacillus suis]